MITELCIDVINSFKALQRSLQTVTEHVCVLDKDLPAWFQAPPSLAMPPQASVRQQACILMQQLEYLDTQQPREILVGAGIIAASNETLIALQELNIAKNIFKQSVLKFKAAKIATNHDLISQNFETMLSQRDPEFASNLRRMGLSRVHLKQCYRKIPYYLLRPNKISWTWANTRSIKKVSIPEAETLLRKHTQDAGIERQIRLLQGLDPNEKLAIIQDLAPHLRANLVLPDGCNTKRALVKGPVPIFYLVDDNLTLPEFNPPGIKRGRNKERVVRNDVKINPEPFLPAIRAHRYYEALRT
jgi:hypothetical protein